METGIKVGHEVSVETATAIGGAIISILEAAHQNYQDAATTQKALDTLMRIASIEELTISGCHIDGTTKNVYMEGDE